MSSADWGAVLGAATAFITALVTLITVIVHLIRHEPIQPAKPVEPPSNSGPIVPVKPNLIIA